MHRLKRAWIFHFLDVWIMKISKFLDFFLINFDLLVNCNDWLIDWLDWFAAFVHRLIDWLIGLLLMFHLFTESYCSWFVLVLKHGNKISLLFIRWSVWSHLWHGRRITLDTWPWFRREFLPTTGRNLSRTSPTLLRRSNLPVWKTWRKKSAF